MSTVKADNFTWKSGQSGGLTGTNVTGDQIVYGVTKAWLNYNGVTPVINKSYSFSSVTKNSTGNYTLNFSSAFADTLYTSAATGGNYATGTPPFIGDYYNGTRTTSAYQICGLSYNTAAYVDTNYIYVMIIR